VLTDDYFDKLLATLARVRQEQRENLARAAEALAHCVSNGGSIYGIGCGHSGLVVQDVFYRAGGLMLINAIFAPGLQLDVRPVTVSSQVERLSGYAAIILDGVRPKAGDALILVSTSGRNAVPVELAQEAKKRGMTVIGVTSRAYTAAAPSRHPSGKHMHDFADIVIDNLSEPGDASIEVPGLGLKMGPTSTSVGCAILHALAMETVALLVEKGHTPPVFMPANYPGGTEHNERLIEQYGDRVNYLR